MIKFKRCIFYTTITSLFLCGNVLAQNTSIASPPPGSVWNTMSNAIAKISLEKANITASVNPLKGNQAMMNAVQDKSNDFAINDINDAIIAVTGEGEYYGNNHSNLRVAMRISPMQIGIFVRKDSGINTINDLRGKRVASGWNTFPLGRSHMSAILATSGLGWDAVEEVPVSNLIDAADALASGKLDATYFALGGPKVAQIDKMVGGVKFLPIDIGVFSEAAMKSIRPAFYFTEISPAPHLVGVEESMSIVTWDNALVVGAHVPDETVYQMVKSIIESKDSLIGLFPGFKALTIDAPRPDYPSLEYHPGAIRYFVEKGL